MRLSPLIPTRLRLRVRRFRALTHSFRLAVRAPVRAPWAAPATAPVAPSRSEAPPVVPVPAPAETVPVSHDAFALRYQGARLSVAEGDTVLDALMDAELDVPFSCQMGGCGACMCKLVEGEVEMETPNCLDEDELANGLILACVSRPLTDIVVAPLPQNLESDR